MLRYHCEIECAPGLEDVSRKELIDVLGRSALSQIKQSEGAIEFIVKHDIHKLESLKTAIAAYVILSFDVPRPKALLGHQNFHIILNQIREIIDSHPQAHFKTLYLSAAGSGSSVMRRITDDLTMHTGLEPRDDEGDLLLRIRRNKDQWQVLIRLTPRPLATRQWRREDMPGALNGPVANAMIRLLCPKPGSKLLNLMSGSGTLMIEALDVQPELYVMGLDIDSDVNMLAQRNIDHSRHADQIRLIQGNVSALPLLNSHFDNIVADLPFGSLVGSHEHNRVLYPQVLEYSARVAKADAAFALITHEIKLFENALAHQSTWTLDKQIKINLRGLHPRIYLLRKSV